jgi:hypothetical protein
MQNFAEAGWTEIMQAVTALPGSWQPRREQPEWDRDFTGRADVQTQFAHQTDKARDWCVTALVFSDTLKQGFRKDPSEDDTRLIEFAKEMRGYIAKGKNQFDA